MFIPLIPLHLLVFLPVLVGALSYFLPRRAYQIVMLAGNLIVVAFCLRLFIAVRWDQDIVQFLAGWPEIVAIKLVADRISAPLVLMTALFFSATYIFSSRADYLDKTFIFIFLMLESALFGVFLSGDLFNIYVIMELGMLAIAILIMYKKDQQAIYNATLYIMMNFIAMAFMMLGIAYVYRITGVLDLAVMEQRIAALQDKRVMIVPFAMIMTAVALKSALLPLFSWLPKAHGAPSAPSIVSAVLSGVQVKVGVYLLVRLGAVFAPAIDGRPFFMWLGFLTSVAGFLLAIAQKDIKLILAYHTISQVGLIVMGLHLGSPVAFWGAMYHVINHALFKGLLFLSAGVIIDVYGTRNYSSIRGVLRRMPVIGIATLAAVFGITGAPFFNGSISKYFISRGMQGDWGELGLFIINFGTILSFVKYSTILFGRADDAVKPLRDPFMAGIALLFGVAILAGGVFGSQAVALVFGQHFSAEGALAGAKLLGFLATVSLAVAVYLLVVRRLDAFLSAVRNFKLNFNQITVLMTLFFALLLGYARLLT
jgi:multicomponent Na+:H+ antiporter subunit D